MWWRLRTGIADGLGYGDNTKAALITRGITEIARLGVAMGGSFETFCGLTGIGDLIVTCASMHSRNRRAGILIGQGYTMKQAMDEVKMVVEGVYSAKATMGLAKKYDVRLPIIEQVNAVLFEGQLADEAVKNLMLRDKKIENQRSPGKGNCSNGRFCEINSEILMPLAKEIKRYRDYKEYGSGIFLYYFIPLRRRDIFREPFPVWFRFGRRFRQWFLLCSWNKCGYRLRRVLSGHGSGGPHSRYLLCACPPCHLRRWR